MDKKIWGDDPENDPALRAWHNGLLESQKGPRGQIKQLIDDLVDTAAQTDNPPDVIRDLARVMHYMTHAPDGQTWHHLATLTRASAVRPIWNGSKELPTIDTACELIDALLVHPAMTPVLAKRLAETRVTLKKLAPEFRWID